MMVAATWLTQLVIVTRHVGHTWGMEHMVTRYNVALWLPHLHPLLALGADDVTVLAAGDRGLAGDGQAHRAHHRLLQLPQERLGLGPLLLQFCLPLAQPVLETPELLTQG